jgi:2-aminoadipate transaminase
MQRAPYVSFPVRALEGRRIAARDVVESVVREVKASRLPAGARLPPVRALERQLGLSKNTVQAAYDELVARGVLEAREREGVFVARASSPSAPPSALPAPPMAELKPPPAIGAGRVPTSGTSLSTVFIDPDLLPSEKLAECARSVLKRPQGMCPWYETQGYAPLREAIADRLRKRGFEVDASEVVVTTGSQQGIDMLARTMKNKRVALESPVYAHARFAFESTGVETVALPLDPFRGPDMTAWARILAATRPSLLYTVSSFQNPTGYSYSSHELGEMIAVARETGVALVEDDWGSDMLSGVEYRPMLRLLGGPSVVYLNSFTKKLWPSLRVGYLVAHRELVPTLVAAKRVSTLGNAWLTEAIVAEFLERGYYDGHLAALQAEMDHRYALCLAALEELMPEGARWTTPGGGPTLWLDLPRAVDLEALAARLAKRDVFIEDAASQFHGEPHVDLHGFRVSYAFSKPDALRRGLEILAEELRRAG